MTKAVTKTKPKRGTTRALVKRTEKGSPSILATMAERWAIDPPTLQAVIVKTCLSGTRGFVPQPEHVAVFLMIAREYDLNPMMGEIHAFIKDGAVHPIIGIDGRLSIMNGQPDYDGIDTTFTFANGSPEPENDDDLPVSVTVKIYHKTRSHPTVITEYMSECRRDTGPWRQWPRRMLRHKGIIQCGRVAFGLRMYDRDDWAELAEAEVVEDVAAEPAAMLSLKAGPDQIPRRKESADEVATATDGQATQPETSDRNAEPGDNGDNSNTTPTPAFSDRGDDGQAPVSPAKPEATASGDDAPPPSTPPKHRSTTPRALDDKPPPPTSACTPRVLDDKAMRADLKAWSLEIANGQANIAAAFIKDWSANLSPTMTTGYSSVASIPKKWLRSTYSVAAAAIAEFRTPATDDDGDDSNGQKALL